MFAKYTRIALLLGVLVLYNSSGADSRRSRKHRREETLSDVDCSEVSGFNDDLRAQIRSKQAQVDKIVDYVTKGKGKHSTYDELALLCDTFGPRMSGTEGLKKATKYMIQKMEDNDIKVHSESAMIPRWSIWRQWAEIVEPIDHPMSILALGRSVGTGGDPIKGEVVVVNTFEQLKELGEHGEIAGKIVVYNYKWTSYAECSKYRTEGAKEAAKYHAIAALVRSLGPFSINSPHAGSGSKSIPTAAITLEDADKIQRIHDRGHKIILRLFIDALNQDDVEGRNVIADIRGSEKPDEYIVASGHLDSWYNTDGAMDDGGGMMITYKAMEVLRKLDIRAKRTMRGILWTAEEFGLIGAQQYLKDHRHELDNFKVFMESDLGTFRPTGLSFKNFGPLGQCVVREMLSMTRDSLNTTTFDSNFEGSDIEVFTKLGSPGLSLANENDRYFWYHHTSGDSITMQNPDHLDQCTALWAVATYVLADLDVADYRQ